jgi:hypothetical protein
MPPKELFFQGMRSQTLPSQSRNGFGGTSTTEVEKFSVRNRMNDTTTSTMAHSVINAASSSIVGPEAAQDIKLIDGATHSSVPDQLSKQVLNPMVNDFVLRNGCRSQSLPLSYGFQGSLPKVGPSALVSRRRTLHAYKPSTYGTHLNDNTNDTKLIRYNQVTILLWFDVRFSQSTQAMEHSAPRDLFPPQMI